MKGSKSIVEKIKESNIKQKPKWYFQLIRLLRWVIYIGCIVMGSLAFSVILYSIQQTDFNAFTHIKHSRLEFFLGLLPFFWIVVMIVFLFLSIFVYRKSAWGYKYKLISLLSFSAFTSVILGLIFYILGGADTLEKAFAEKISYYETVREQKINAWMQPENGFLGGEIISLNPETLWLKDFGESTWEIDFQGAFVAEKAQLQVGAKVKLIGMKTGDKKFRAEEIRPWVGRRAYPNMQPSE